MEMCEGHGLVWQFTCLIRLSNTSLFTGKELPVGHRQQPFPLGREWNFPHCKHAKFGGRSQGAKGGKVHEFWNEGENLSTSHLLLAGVSTIGLYCHLVVVGGMSREMHPVQGQQIKPDRARATWNDLSQDAHRSLRTFCKMLPVRLCFASSLHKGPTKTQRCHSPSVVPSSPMMVFIEVIICWATGGDMEVAYRALCEWHRR